MSLQIQRPHLHGLPHFLPLSTHPERYRERNSKVVKSKRFWGGGGEAEETDQTFACPQRNMPWGKGMVCSVSSWPFTRTLLAKKRLFLKVLYAYCWADQPDGPQRPSPSSPRWITWDSSERSGEAVLDFTIGLSGMGLFIHA